MTNLEMNSDYIGLGEKIICPICSSIHCLRESHEDTESYLCMTCGYTSNTLYKKNSPHIQQIVDTSPRLIIDLLKFDEDRQIFWFPTVLQMTTGIAFPVGNKDEWKWNFAPIVEISESERKNYPVVGEEGKYHEKRIADELCQTFERTEFYKVLKVMGAIIDIDEIENTTDPE